MEATSAHQFEQFVQHLAPNDSQVIDVHGSISQIYGLHWELEKQSLIYASCSVCWKKYDDNAHDNCKDSQRTYRYCARLRIAYDPTAPSITVTAFDQPANALFNVSADQLAAAWEKAAAITARAIGEKKRFTIRIHKKTEQDTDYRLLAVEHGSRA